jgi:hypothetical protein
MLNTVPVTKGNMEEPKLPKADLHIENMKPWASKDDDEKTDKRAIEAK